MLARVLRGPFPPETKAAAICLACHKPDSDLKLPATGEPAKLEIPAAIAAFVRADSLTGCITITLPVSRLCARAIAWCLVAVGIVASISSRTVQRILKSTKVKPWRFRSWITPKNLCDFLPKAAAILDFYERIQNLPPDHVAYSADEKTSIQAREHATHEPSQNGKPARVENTYKRRGAVNLFAALNVASGSVFGQVSASKTFLDFAAFLTALINKAVDDGKRVIHLILDNGSTHRPKRLAGWLQETFPHVRVEVHWLPVRSSWLNQVEIFFSLLQTQALTPNNFQDTAATTKRILSYIDWHNIAPQPIRWDYSAADLYRKYGQERPVSEGLTTSVQSTAA